MANTNFIPTSAAEFDAWQLNLVDHVNNYKGGWNWNSDAVAEWDQLTGVGNVKQARWEAAWAIVSSKEFLGSDETEYKGARKAYESGNVNNSEDTSLRIFIRRYITHNKRVTSTQKKAMRLTVPDMVRTAAADPGAKVLGSYLALRKQIHLSIQIEVIYPETKSKAKRKGIKEVMVFMGVQDAGIKTTPAPETLLYAGDMSYGIYTATFLFAQEGMKAFFAIREKNSKGKLGNFSSVLGITIA
ncbi:MAG TPA: hypothetical protein VF411_02010 [Bacteroidia bacterium]